MQHFPSLFSMLSKRVIQPCRSFASKTEQSSVAAFKKQSLSEEMNTKERADHARATSRVRVLTLYKAFYRGVPNIATLNKSAIPVVDLRALMKNEFAKNSNVSDTRAIELLLGKGQIDLQEFLTGFAQETHMHRMLDNLLSNDPLPTDFVSKFLRAK